MNTTIILITLIIFFYTLGFSHQLWKDKHKIGSITVLILSLAIIITPFFTVLK